jgi:hypothetical protein
MRRSYFSLEAFYAASSMRARSREVDVGLYWREGYDGPTCRAAWIRDTGEVYAVRHGRPEDGGGRVEILGRFAGEPEMRRAFDGWREVCGQPDSTSWLRRRAASRALDLRHAS